MNEKAGVFVILVQVYHKEVVLSQYTIFTSDMPITNKVKVATYADDTAIIASNESPIIASKVKPEELNRLQNWLIKWSIKVNSKKQAYM